MNRRSLILGAASLFAAPAIVKADSLMKLWMPKLDLTGTEVAERMIDFASGPIDIEIVRRYREALIACFYQPSPSGELILTNPYLAVGADA